MTADQALLVVAKLTSEMPTYGAMSKATVLAWQSHLRDLDFEDTMEAAHGWAQTSSEFPTVFDIRSATRRIRARRTEHARFVAPPAELEEARLPVATVSEMIAAMKEDLRTRSAAAHLARNADRKKPQ